MLSKTTYLYQMVDILVGAIKKSRSDYAKDMAASIAFFTFFSLFPLLLGLITIVSFFVDPNDLGIYLDQLLFDSLPGSGGFVRENIDAIFRQRAAAGAISVLGLLWSAQKMAGAVSRGINRALDQDKRPSLIGSRIRYFLITLSIPVLLLMMIAVLTTIELIITLDIDSTLGVFSSLEHLAASWRRGIVVLFVFTVFFLIYKYVPYKKMSSKDVFPGALVSTFLYEIGKKFFILYLDNVAEFESIYGSLSSIIVLLIWLYYTGRVLLFGAEFIIVKKQYGQGSTAT